MSRPSMVSGSDSLAQWLFPCTCSHGVHYLRSVLDQIAGSVLVHQCVLGLDWLLAPASAELASEANPSLGSWFSSTTVKFVASPFQSNGEFLAPGLL